MDLLLTQRNEAKRRRDFVVADAIRDELKVEHSVGVHDRDRTWWLGRQQRPARPQRPPLPSDHGYAREIGDNTPLVDETAVDALLLQRMHAKMTRDFTRADALRAELSSVHGVRVHDGRKVWRAGVDADTADPWARVEDVYERDSRDGGGAVDDAAVQALLRRRSVARRRRHWQLADDILEQLLDLGVVVNDKTRTYAATSTTCLVLLTARARWTRTTAARRRPAERAPRAGASSGKRRHPTGSSKVGACASTTRSRWREVWR